MGNRPQPCVGKGRCVTDQRCDGEKPDGRPCNTLFFRFENATIELKCQRCNKMHLFNVEDFTASSAQTVIDKPVKLM